MTEEQTTTIQNRFNAVTFNATNAQTHAALKDGFNQIAQMIETSVVNYDSRQVILNKLQEAFMWAGYAIKDQQLYGAIAAPKAIDAAA